MNNDDLYGALACADALDEKYTRGGGMTFELQAANALRLLCDEVGALRDEIAVAVAAEREACAKIIDDLSLAHPGRADLTALQCAAAIRARGQQ